MGDPRGVLYPQHLPGFTRYAPAQRCADLVQWFWVPRWDLPRGVTRRQEVLPFPAANLAIEPGQITLTGPTTRVTHRELTGRGWALGALLQPAGLSALGVRAGEIIDAVVPRTDPDLYETIRAAMAAGEDTAAITHLSSWLSNRARPDERAMEANAVLAAIAASPQITTTRALADALHRSPRTIQRLAEEYLGLRPLELIRRYRLQEAAKHLREGTDTIAAIAARLHYTDHAHLTSDFRRTFGYSPREYRERT